MIAKNLILATAGHVDHGKTALVKALTGVDTDRLPEEKARGITIDLGFAHLAFPSTINHQPSTISLGLIDVPGHEDFVRNMIAGVGSIDLALLVVAADDGWMPQTEEHVQILDYLGVRHGVVAITKCDLGDGEPVAEHVRQQLQGTSLGEIPILLTSVRSSAGFDLLKQTLTQECLQTPVPRDLGKARLFVDRVFTMRGSGTVVTGTLTGGHLSRGETVSLQPQNLRARIRALQSHNQPLEVAPTATRVALNLPDLRLDQVPRGTLITTVTPAQPSRTIDVAIERSGRQPPTAHSLKTGSFLHVHYGSARHVARVTLLDQPQLVPGERALARLWFKTPLFAFAGDRFILRDSSAQQTIAGGLVLDPAADETRFRSSARRAFLRARAAAPNDLQALLRTQLLRDNFARIETLLLKSNFGREEIEAAIDELGSRGELLRRNGIVADAAWWQALCDRVTQAIDAEHSAHPNYAGMEMTQLRATLETRDPQLFDVLVEHLCEHGFERAGSAIRRSGYRPSLPPQLQTAAAEIRRAFAARSFDPPSRKELIRDARTQEALRFLCETGEVLLLNEDVVVTAAAFAQMEAQVREALRARGTVTTSELRQLLGTTRRILVPLLERLDRAGLTIRQGDRRALREHVPAR